MKWIFRNGIQQSEWASFPLAFRSMHNIVMKRLAGGEKFADITKNMVIISPAKNHYGENRKYDYEAASQMATANGLLTADGTINGKEFKKR